MRAGRFTLELGRPLVMGVVNVTPDSFSDGGRFFDRDAAIAHAYRLAEEGADILDIGGESTRPGSGAITEEEELRRVLPVLQAISGLGKPVSVDTRRPNVMREVLAAGASMINDIEALRQPGALDAVRNGECAVCLMHMKGTPATMQQAPHYDDVVAEVLQFLKERVDSAIQAGIARERIVVDPGFGFGKDMGHNLTLLRALDRFDALGVPVLAGLSRKNTIGRLTGRPMGERLAGSLAAALLAVQAGATIVRVHDVRETRDVLAVWQGYQEAG